MGFTNKKKLRRIYMNGFVYLITRNDGLQYVGITNNVKKRISAHKKQIDFQLE
jgi:predicted GIY-YIG superfamily endonuclease